MRFSEWRGRAPMKDSVGPKVIPVVEAALVTLGAEPDPECWVAWGDDPAVRYLLLAPTPSGLVQLNVRVNVPGEGPRAGGKIVRWARVQLGELGVEIQGGHRLVTFQVDTLVLNGVDEAADRVAAFAQALFAAIDGRVATDAGHRLEAQRAGVTTGHQGRRQVRHEDDGEPGARRPDDGERPRRTRIGFAHRSRVTTAGRSALPGPAISPWRRTIRYWISRFVVAGLTRGYLRVRLEGRDRLPPGPAVYCFNHMSWADPFVLMAVLPFRPRLWFFGPKEEDLRVGGRNRVMYWTGSAIPYKPAKNDLLEVTRRVSAVMASGGVVAIAGEGRIHVRECELLPLSDGAAYFAMRSSVPLIPVAIRGTSWLRFGGRVTIRVGEAIAAERPAEPRGGRRGHGSTDRLAPRPRRRRSRRARARPVGRWLTERFNDWPEGSRDAARAASRNAWSGILRAIRVTQGGTVAGTGLSADPKEYRARLADQSDDQIDTWTAELMRDVVIRRGIVKVVADFRRATRLDERAFERVFASGGGPPAMIGRDAKGRLVVPTTTLYALVPGIRAQVPDGRERLIEYLLENFDEIVYV